LTAVSYTWCSYRKQASILTGTTGAARRIVLFIFAIPYSIIHQESPNSMGVESSGNCLFDF
jgi:hypothetical protein